MIRTLPVFTVLLISSMSFAQAPDTLWTKLFNNEAWDQVNSILQTPDSGYICAGYSGAQIPENKLWVIKTDQNGDLQWELYHGDSLNTKAGVSVLITSDGGYLVTGETFYAGNWWSDITLFKLDSDGSIEQEVYFDIGPVDYARASQQTSDGGCIVAGGTGGTNLDCFLLKIDSEYNTEWITTTGGDQNEQFYSVQQTSDGGYIAAGYTSSFGSGSSDHYMVKFDSFGNVEWEVFFGGTGFDMACSARQTQDGGYIIVGFVMQIDTTRDLYVVKTDCDGNPEWDLILDRSDFDNAISFLETSDGSYILTGVTSKDLWLLKLDNTGSVLWETAIGLPNPNESGRSIQQTVDGGYVVAGSRNTSAGQLDFWLVKFGPELGISHTTQPVIDIQISAVLPNPFTSSLQINCFLPSSGHMNLSVYDFAGRLVEHLESSDVSSGEHTFLWDPDPLLPSGCYMVVLDALGKQDVTRCIKI